MNVVAPCTHSAACGILAPGNAPWVITVGASSTEGTARVNDDVVAGFSSLGPTRGDYLAKPDKKE